MTIKAVETGFESFFKKIDDFFKTIGHEATWEKTASTTLAVAAPLLDTLVTLTLGEPAGELVAKTVSAIQTKMAQASALLAGAEAGVQGGVTVASVFSDINSNLGTLLADADVKNSKKIAQVESIAKTVTGEISAIMAAMPASPTAA
jgi:hypothetical protein